MSDKWFRKAYQDFSGGTNNLESPLIIKQNQFTELTNATVNDTGLLEKAKGYSVDGSPFPDDVDSFIRMLINYKRGTTVDKLVCAALDEGNTNVTYQVDLKETSGDGNYAYIYYVDGTSCAFTNANTAVVGIGTSWSTQLKAGDKIKSFGHTDAMYTEIASVTNDTNLVLVAGGYLGATVTVASTSSYKARRILNKDFIPSAIVFNNNLVITNGSDTPLSYNNTALSNITDADCPKGKFIAAHKSRVFIGATSGGPSTIFWSAVNDETSWDATSLEPIFANDNGNICGMKSFSDSLIVLKDNGNIYQVVGSFDQDSVGEPDYIRRIDTPTNIGTIAGFTAQVHDDNKLYFLAETGVYSLDSRMFVNKESWNINNTIKDVVLRSGNVSAKAVIFDSKTEWDTGSHSGTIVRSDGVLRQFFDTFSISNASKTYNHCAITIDSTNIVHIVYVDSADTTKIKYAKYLATDNTVTYEDVVTNSGAVLSVSIAVASTGNVAIGYTSYNKYAVVERDTGVWGSSHVMTTAGGEVYARAERISVSYAATGNDIFVAFNQGTLSGVLAAGAQLSCEKRLSGTWSTVSNIGPVNTVSNAVAIKVKDNRIALSYLHSGFSDNYVYLSTFVSTNSGASFSSVESSFQVDTSGFGMLIGNPLDNWGLTLELGTTYNLISSYVDFDGKLKRRNHTTTTTTVVSSNTSNHFKGYVNYLDNHYHLLEISTNESFSANGTTITNSSTGTLSTIISGDKGMVNNGPVFATASFGANANEIIIRRLAFVGVWTGPEESDSTLTAWGIYDVGSQVTNGNTVLHQIALNTISPPSSYNTITSGSVISTDATQVFSRVKVTITTTVFASSEIGSVTINYTGTGVGPLLPTSLVFDNELYLSVGISGETANSKVLVFDKAKAWTEIGYPVIFMARYRGSLYGGASTTGRVYKLLQNYRFNASAYTLTAVSKEDLLGSLELEKEVYKVYVIYKIQSSGTFDFSYRTSSFTSTSGSSWSTTTIDQTSGGIEEIPITSGLLKSIQFKVESDDLDAQLGIVGWVILYKYVNLR